MGLPFDLDFFLPSKFELLQNYLFMVSIIQSWRD